MTITLGELILAVILSLGIGLLLGTERGWDHACATAQVYAKEHRTGERLIQVPAQFKVDAVVYGSQWLAGKICEGR
jgi:hypothetical protein